MRIKRLVLRNYRGVEESEIEFPSEGVTIVEGENEVGKTSFAEALHLVFDYLDSSKSTKIKEIQPVHRDAAPQVEVELTAGPYHLIYAKQWLRRPSTTLTVLSPAREQLTGREAHERVNQILDEAVDRVLWDALRLEQGHDLTTQGSYVMPSLSRALESAVGADRTGEHEDELWKRIVQEKDRYWSATGRPSTERQRLAERVAQASTVVSEIEASIREVEARTEEMARLEAESVDLARAQAELVAREAETAAQAHEVGELRRTVAQVEAEARVAAAEHDKRLATLHARQALAAEVEQRRQNLARSESELAESEPARAGADRRLAQLMELRSEAIEALRSAEEVADQAAADTAYRRRQIEIEQFRERRDRALQAQADLEAAEQVLTGTRIPPEAVAAIEAAQLEVAKAEAAASAGAAAVTAVAEVRTEIHVDGQPLTLERGVDHEIPVAASTDLEVPGVVRFTVHAGAEAQVHADRLERARSELTRLCERHGVADLGEARRICADQAEADRISRAATERLAFDLRDLTIEGLARKIEAHTARLTEFEATRSDRITLPADLDHAQEAEAAAQRELSERRTALARLETEVETAHTVTKDVSVSGATLVERVNIDRASLTETAARLEADRSVASDHELEVQAQLAAEVRRQADARHAEATQALEQADPQTLQLVVADAREARERGETAIRANHDRRQQLGALIEDRGEQGLAHRLDVAVAEADRLTVEASRLEMRAHAAKVLFETFDRRRAEARQKFVAPFREKIEQLGRLVFGPTLEVELDDDLCIAQRTLDGVTVGFNQLSAGAREQFALICRLACAALVSVDGGGAPVVFDDALGWTDPRRLAQMAAAIGVAGRQCQIIVLTCTPGRFSGVAAASVVRLGAEPLGTETDHADDPVDPSLTA